MLKTIKKTLALVLSLTLLLSVVPSVFAGENDVTVGAFSLKIDTVSVIEGSAEADGVIPVPVRITGLPETSAAITSTAFTFTFDHTKLELQLPAAKGEIKGSMIKVASDALMGGKPTTNGSQGIFEYSLAVTSSSDNYITASLITTVGSNVYVTLPFKLLDKSVGTYAINMVPKDAVYYDGAVQETSKDDVAAAVTAGAIEVKAPDKIMTIVNDAGTQTIAGAQSWADVKGTLNKVSAESNNNLVAFGGTKSGTLSVNWNEPAGYGKGVEKADGYDVTGTVVLPDGVVADTSVSLNATMKLIVTKLVATKVEGAKDVSVSYNTSEENAIKALEKNAITVTAGGNTYKDATVTWSFAEYDPKKAGKYEATATVKRDGIDFSELKAPILTANVTVNAEVIADDPIVTNPGTSNNYGGSTRYLPIESGNAKVSISFIIGEFAYMRNNTAVPMDVPTKWDATGERTLVPVRFMSEALGYAVSWNEVDQTVSIQKDGITIVMTIGSNVYTVNGVERTMDTAAELADGRTYVPIRFVAEALGASVGWDGSVNRVTIVK